MTNIALCPLDRWTGYAAKLPEAAAIMRNQIEAAKNLGCTMVNICTSDKLDYLTNENSKSKAVLDMTQDLHVYANEQGLDTSQSGPKLFKHWFLARRLALPISHAPVETVHVGESKITDESKRIYFTELAQKLAQEPEYTLIRLSIRTTGPGYLYLLHADDSNINKVELKVGVENHLSHVNLPGIRPHNLVFVSTALHSVRVTVVNYTRNEISETDATKDGWTGSTADGFLQCRTVDPTDHLGIMQSHLMAERYISGVPQICLSDELNSPFGYDLDPELFPHGWPQWAAQHIAQYSVICNAQTGRGPLFFQLDPRADVNTLRFNRYCKPVPEGSPTDYLYWLAKYKPECVIGIWGEKAPAAHWKANLDRVLDYGFEPAIMIYSGKQDIQPVVNGIGKEHLQNLPVFVFYWQVDWPTVAQTVNKLKQALS